eukprot:scaffold139603_cov31-Tisochrysis_lutea.AAC.3
MTSIQAKSPKDGGTAPEWRPHLGCLGFLIPSTPSGNERHSSSLLVASAAVIPACVTPSHRGKCTRGDGGDTLPQPP